TIAANQTSYTETGLTPGATYFRYIVAVASGGIVTSSGVSEGIMDPIPPGISPGVAAYQYSSSNTVSVYWTEPGDDNYTGTIGAGGQFAIQYSSADPTVVTWSTTTAQVVLSTSGVTPGTTVHYDVYIGTNAFTYFRVWMKDA